jgi:hypothetical protein
MRPLPLLFHAIILALGGTEGNNFPVDLQSALHFDNAVRNTPWDFRAPTLIAFYSTSNKACVDQLFATSRMNFVAKATDSHPRTRLMVGLYDIDAQHQSTWYHWAPDKMDLALRFGVKSCPTLAIVPPEYAHPENRTVDPIIWDRHGAWVTWLKDNVRKMKQPQKSKIWTQAMLQTRDESEHGEWVRCANYPPQLKRYTETGYHKMQMPKPAYKRLMAFYNKHKSSRTTEMWKGNQTQTNFHEVPMTMVSLDSDQEERDAIANDLIAPTLRMWTKTTSLKLNSFYGIREYHRGSELHMHIDRMESHAVSGILNLAQEGMEEDWMLEVQL